ncbi:MAG: TetR/AcrR family transcriptional regulator [Desulfotomaculaceae bacterium]|nr:TetR/AcrR family transcriptional regulator [Desulfotomaculaceae bacterium]
MQNIRPASYDRLPNGYPKPTGGCISIDYRQRITAALKDQAKERGFSRVTVDDLVAVTGISKRTIYRYFRSKEEIIVSVMEDLMCGIEKDTRKAVEASVHPIEKITGAIGVVLQNITQIQPQALHDVQKYYPQLWESVEQFRAEKIQHIFEELLMGNGEDCFRKVNPKIFTAALLAGIRAVVNPNFIMENNLSPEETIQALFDIFLNGITVEKTELNQETGRSILP